jgi:hypothetical protein
MLRTNGTQRLDPQRGALRLWYMPSSWSSSSPGQGAGPGSVARLLTLLTTNGGAGAVWWSLAIAQDGNSLSLNYQSTSGSTASLSVPISFQSGVWHCLAFGYTETNSALFIDGQQVAAGDGFATVTADAMPLSALVVGSTLTGTEVAAGQIDELYAFEGQKRFYKGIGQVFGLSPDWEIAFYYTNYSHVAALGPISDAEEAARQARWAALKAAREAEAAAAPATSTSMQTMDAGTPLQQPAYDPTSGFTLSTPVIQGTNLFLTLSNGDPTISYDIYYTPTLSPAPSWSIIVTGAIAQTSYNVPIRGTQGYLRGAVGGDWDGDGVPNWMDADPRSTNIGALTITIDSPANGTIFQ